MAATDISIHKLKLRKIKTEVVSIPSKALPSQAVNQQKAHGAHQSTAAHACEQIPATGATLGSTGEYKLKFLQIKH